MWEVPILITFGILALLCVLPELLGFVRAHLLGGLPKNPVRIAYVVDGDTVDVEDANGRVWRVRLEGIDADESSVCDKLFRDAERKGRRPDELLVLGQRAKSYLRDLAPKGTPARLTYSRTNVKNAHRGFWDRIVAYVYIQTTEGEVMLNLAMIHAGHAEATPFKHAKRKAFMRAERESLRPRRRRGLLRRVFS